MANAISVLRTNYFKVKDINAFEAFLNTISCDDSIHMWTEDGRVAFGAYDSLTGIKDSDDAFNVEEVYAGIQKHLAKHDICIITEITHTKLRNVSAYSVIISAGTIDYLNFDTVNRDAVRKMTGDPGWDTRFNC